MKRLVSTEILKLRTTRAPAGIVLGAAALMALVAVASSAIAQEPGEVGLATANHLVQVVRGSTLGPLGALLLGVLLVAGEVQHRTLTSTFLVEPRRARVLAAKLVTGGAAGLTTVTVMMTVGLGITLTMAAVEGASADLLDSRVLEAAAGTYVAGALFGVVGAGLGAALRSQAAALVAVAVWVIVLEGVASSVLGAETAQWLPGGAAQAVAGGGGDGALPMWGAAAVLAGYATLLAGIGARTFVRGDLT